MIAILKTFAVTLALVDVRVALLDGRTLNAKLEGLTADDVVIVASDGQSTSVPLTDVVDIAVGGADDVEAAAGSAALREIILSDSSVLGAGRVQVSSNQVVAESDALGDLRIPRSSARAVRLQDHVADWQPQWQAFLKRRNEKDLLVAVKRDGTGLDFLSGVVSTIDAETVSFLLDGDEIEVPRKRVYGVVFAAVEVGDAGGSDVSVNLIDGTTVGAKSVVKRDEQFQLQSSWDQQLLFDIDMLLSVDFSGGRLHYLSDLEPLSERYFGMDPPGKEWGELFSEDVSTRTGLSSQWRMSRDRFPNNGRPPLTLRGRVYRKGLCIFPHAAVQYALDGRYSKLTAVVGVDDDVAFNQRRGRTPTAVELRVETDGQEVLKRLVSAPEDPFPLELDLAGVSTLTVIVDFGDNDSTCDYLDLADARLIIDTAAGK